MIIGKALYYLSSHPGLLPDGEGIASFNESPGVIASMVSIKPGLA